MDAVRPFGQRRILDLLASVELGHIVQADGSICVPFGPTVHRERTLFVNVGAGDDGTFTMTASLRTTYASEQVAVLLREINAWCRDNCWPRAFLAEIGSDGHVVTAVADQHILLSHGATDTQLSDALWVFIANADRLLCSLERSVHQRWRQALPSDSELSTWFNQP